MFGFFKKKEQEPHYDPTNLKVTDLRKGYVLDYDFKTWQAIEEYEFDWGNEFFSYEYKLQTTDDTVYLYVEEDDDLILSVSRKIKFHALGEEVEKHLEENEKPPKKIVYQGVTYYRGKESVGFTKEIDDPGESVEYIVWNYEDETEELILTIEQWGDEDFSASVGKYISPNDITNILPIKND